MHKMKILFTLYMVFIFIPTQALSDHLSDSALTPSIILKGEIVSISNPVTGQQSDRWTIFRYSERLYACRIHWDLLPRYFNGTCVHLRQVEYH